MAKILLHKRILLPALIISIVYFILTVFLTNYALVWDTITGVYPIMYKARLLMVLVTSVQYGTTVASYIGLLLIALLVGINITLLQANIRQLKQQKNLHLMVGGSSIIGIVGGSCAACGISLLSIFGISSSLFYALPLKGLEITLITILLLFISLFTLLKQNQTYCTINARV